jgi:alpha-amylase/alpha-mannosidase (GH57 family)
VAPARAITIHGHFYQPPRENPWLESVEVQDSASPYHDWNERVTAECYAPNTAARRVDADNRIIDISNNFEHISFNVGPTLFAWLARHRADVAAKIVEADRVSVAARGHGNAIGQVYNHMIMPLAARRDKVTQVRWGVEDFRFRFGRDPEGFWLPETAVDDETLEMLAEAGLRFTILAPHQAWRVRRLDGEAWQEVNDRIDPSRPYLWRGPRGLTLALFFYDGPISRAIAFENLLQRGEHIVERLRGAFADGRDEAQLVHCATDGESYGHHSPFGDMALAAALEQITRDKVGDLTNYGAFLAAHPPAHEVQIRQRTSWSCVHGVERWRSDCGCRTRGEWHQRWRAPLREALDWLRDQLDPLYEARASAVLKDPWAARDAYIEVVLERTPERLGGFLAAQQRTALDSTARVEARRALEMQRNRLLMYTSCGWFFDELSGLEPVQILKYAAMAIQYGRDLGGGNLEGEFVRRLETAPTNVAEFPTGGDVYRKLIKPAVVELRRVVAHYAINGLFQDYPDDARVYAFGMHRLDEQREGYDGTQLRMGHCLVRSDVTGDSKDVMYAVLHFGGHDFSCGVRAFEDNATYDAIRTDLFARYARYSLADMVRGLDEHFPDEPFSLQHLFLEERRRVVASVIKAVLERYEETYRRIWEENRKLVRYLRQADAPIPDALAIVARHVLEQDVYREIEGVAEHGTIPPHVFELVEEARTLGLPLDLSPARAAMQRAVARALQAVAEEPTSTRINEAIGLVRGAGRLGVRFGLWAAQNEMFRIWRRHPAARVALTPLAEILGFRLALEQPR